VAISINVIMHVGVCAGFFPTTGQPLPFVSYGGSALCTMMFFCGVMLSISGDTTAELQNSKYETRELVHRAWAKQRLGTG
jgi:cell division protein FtsW